MLFRSNNSRQDAITPIVSALNLPNLHLLKDSGEVQLNEQFTFNVMSVFDQERWVKPSNPDAINIALLHGSVSGIQTDTGYVMEHGEFDVKIFEGHDYAFLGDIHKTNQIVDTEGRVRYPGSTVQQNFGETDDKGFLIGILPVKITLLASIIQFLIRIRLLLLYWMKTVICLLMQKQKLALAFVS